MTKQNSESMEKMHSCRLITATAAVLILASVVTGEAQSTETYPINQPPGGIRADHYLPLFGGRVFVGQALGGTMVISHTARSGRFFNCFFNFKTKAWTSRSYGWKVRRYLVEPHRREPALSINGGTSRDVYDGRTGAVRTYVSYPSRWRRISTGHLQARLPRVVWKLCPKFPGAGSLGLKVNEAQTATTYSALVRQSRGRRILRPDLVTPDPAERLDPGTGKWRLSNGKRVRQVRHMETFIRRARSYRDTRRTRTGQSRTANTGARRTQPVSGR